MSAINPVVGININYGPYSPPQYQAVSVTSPADHEGKTRLGNTLHELLLAVAPGFGLVISRDSVWRLYQELHAKKYEFYIYRAAVRVASLDHMYDNNASVRDANDLVAWYIVSLLVMQSSKLSEHLANNGYVRITVLPDRLQFEFPDFKYE